jgi:hypothetical protein
MLHAYVERFDVMGERGNILGLEEEVNKAKGEFSGAFFSGGIFRNRTNGTDAQ